MKFTTRKKILTGAVCAALYAVPFLTIDGAIDIFLKSGDAALKGESTVPGYEGWIEIDTFQFGGGVSATYSGGSLSRSAVNLSEVTVSKLMDQTSTGFFSHLTSPPSSPPEMLLYLSPQSNPGRLVKIYLKSPLVTSVSWSGSEGSAVFESVNLTYEAIKIEHYTTDEKGGAVLTGSTVWSVTDNKAVY